MTTKAIPQKVIRAASVVAQFLHEKNLQGQELNGLVSVNRLEELQRELEVAQLAQRSQRAVASEMLRDVRQKLLRALDQFADYEKSCHDRLKDYQDALYFEKQCAVLQRRLEETERKIETMTKLAKRRSQRIR